MYNSVIYYLNNLGGLNLGQKSSVYVICTWFKCGVKVWQAHENTVLVNISFIFTIVNM